MCIRDRIATSLSEDEFSAEELKKLYQLRWNIEVGFREAKYILGMEAFHSKQENSICQEIYSRIIMYNFSILIDVYKRQAWRIPSSQNITAYFPPR